MEIFHLISFLFFSFKFAWAFDIKENMHLFVVPPQAGDGDKLKLKK